MLIFQFKQGYGELVSLDYLFVNEAVDTFDDYDTITNSVTETEDYGAIY